MNDSCLAKYRKFGQISERLDNPSAAEPSAIVDQRSPLALGDHTVDDVKCATPQCQTTLILLYSADFEGKSKAIMKPHIVGDAHL